MSPIIRPIGRGDLKVTRTQLIGYEPGEVSHIENVLEGELLRRSTRREEENELTITEETDTTQVEERDQQSTTRNEVSSEAQKEANRQASSSADQTTTTEYGKLVENSKTNYARSVTENAVNTLTRMVKSQRVQRERKSFTEEAVHELDNRGQNRSKVRGIYQWVDKKYKARVLNYGTRLLYDVVVPEPAAFLIDSLKNAVQPEAFQLTKPMPPKINPSTLGPTTYMDYAQQYGVTGSVAPPPEEFITVTHQDAPSPATGIVKAFGKDWETAYVSAFFIHVPEGYMAVSGYVQKTRADLGDRLLEKEGTEFEFFIGQSVFIQFSPLHDQFINTQFRMNEETGDIAVTFRSFPQIIKFNYAVGINCKLTDTAFHQWQLKTHAAIMAGYQRQLADYEDKLNRYQASVRSQMARTQNYAHDPSVEEQELKKALISLLVGEHLAQYKPAPDPNFILFYPAYIRDWGAMVAFFERVFEWENMMYVYYPYFWGRPARWGELILIQDINPQFEAFLKAGAARVVVPVRPGFEGALAHYDETGQIWMGKEMPDMFSDYYVSIIDEIKASNFPLGQEPLVEEWEFKLPTTLIMLREDETLPQWAA